MPAFTNAGFIGWLSNPRMSGISRRTIENSGHKWMSDFWWSSLDLCLPHPVSEVCFWGCNNSWSEVEEVHSMRMDCTMEEKSSQTYHSWSQVWSSWTTVPSWPLTCPQLNRPLASPADLTGVANSLCLSSFFLLCGKAVLAEEIVKVTFNDITWRNNFPSVLF